MTRILHTCTLLALYALTLAQSQSPEGGSLPPAPTGPSGPGPATTGAPFPPGDPLIIIGGYNINGDDGPTIEGGYTLGADTAGAYTISGQTLRRGSHITVQGTT